MKFNMLEFVEENAPELETAEPWVDNLKAYAHSAQLAEDERRYLEFLELNEYPKDYFSFLDYLAVNNLSIEVLENN